MTALSSLRTLTLGMPPQPTDYSGRQTEAERHRTLRREAQRRRRSNEPSIDCDNRRIQNTTARRLSRSILSEDCVQIRHENTVNRANHRNVDNTQRAASSVPWWDCVAILNSSQIIQPLRLLWNRNCNNCGIKVHSIASTTLRFPDRNG
jgi:hypothetical protein